MIKVFGTAGLLNKDIQFKNANEVWLSTFVWFTEKIGAS